MDRPSFREIDLKLSQAKESVSQNNILTINPAALASDAFDLGYLISELTETLSEILDEIRPKDYVGRRPPEKSYEDEIKDSDLFCLQMEQCTVWMRGISKIRNIR